MQLPNPFEHLCDIKAILEKEKCSRIFLVTGKKSFETTGAKDILRKLLDGYTKAYYSEFSTNPKIEDVVSGVKLVSEFSPDIVIAIGGGSVMDTAKLICSLSEDYIESKKIILGQLPLGQRNFPLVAIPTTAGSGSESTHFAVVYIDGEKFSLANKSLLPDYIVLDSSLTHSLPKKQTAIAALDAFCQAIESYWAVDSTDESRSLSKESLLITLNNYDSVVSNPNNDTRRNMLKASFLAGKAINITKTTAPHALSYCLTSKYNVPHGHAVALTIGQFFIFHTNSGEKSYNGNYNKSILLTRMKELFHIINVEDSLGVNDYILNMMIKGGLETRLSRLGVKNNEALIELCLNINYERLKNNPVNITPEIAFKFYSNIF